MQICRIKSLYYICGICVQSIPSLPNLCVHWKLASQGIKTAKYKLDSKPHKFSDSWATSLLLIPIEHAPSNQINEYNEWWLSTLITIPTTTLLYKLCCHYSGTSSCFLVEFFPWKKLFPFNLTIPTCQLTFTAARVSSKGSSLWLERMILKSMAMRISLRKMLLLYMGFIEISRMFLCFWEINKKIRNHVESNDLFGDVSRNVCALKFANLFAILGEDLGRPGFIILMINDVRQQ